MTAAFLIILLASGIFILTYESMKDLYDAVRIIFKRLLLSFRGTDFTEKGEVWEHVRILMGITLGMGKDRSVMAFFGLSGLLSLSSMVLLSGKVPLELNILSSLLGAFLPYIMLLIRREKLRIQSSKEGEKMLRELMDNYKIYYFNMKEAIDRTAMTLRDAPRSKRILTGLSRGLDRAGSERSISRLLEEFSLSINTSWSNTLKNLMYFSLVYGVRVDEGMEDLGSTLKSARMVEEYSRRENNESSLMIKYMVPFIYLMTAVSGIRIFGLGAEKFMHYQFGTEVGATWFTILAVIYIISYIVNLFLSENKLDL